MKLYRINAVFLRHLILVPRDLNRFVELIYWPFMDIVLWGFMSFWVQKESLTAELPLILLTALVLWSLVYRANMEISYSLLDELWSHNMVNLFSSPLTFSEWVVAVLMLGIVKVLFVFFYSIAAIYFLYSLNVLSLGLSLIPYALLLIISGWSIGFIVTAVICFFGQKLQTLVWVTAYLFVPFSAVYYPVSSLPVWAQKISYCLPMTYIFEGMRELVATGIVNRYYLLWATILNIVFCVVSLLFFKYIFEKTKIYGLARLERFE